METRGGNSAKFFCGKGISYGRRQDRNENAFTRFNAAIGIAEFRKMLSK